MARDLLGEMLQVPRRLPRRSAGQRAGRRQSCRPRKQALGRSTRRIGDLGTRQHARNLLPAAPRRLERRHGTFAPPRVAAFWTRRCWLARAATWGAWVTTRTWAKEPSRSQTIADRIGGGAADTGVDLVEH